MSVEVRGELCEVDSGDPTQVARLAGQVPWPLSHPTGPVPSKWNQNQESQNRPVYIRGIQRNALINYPCFYVGISKPGSSRSS